MKWTRSPRVIDDVLVDSEACESGSRLKKRDQAGARAAPFGQVGRARDQLAQPPHAGRDRAEAVDFGRAGPRAHEQALKIDPARQQGHEAVLGATRVEVCIEAVEYLLVRLMKASHGVEQRR